MLFPVIFTFCASLATVVLTLFFLSPLTLILPILLSILLSIGNYYSIVQYLPKRRRNISDAPYIILFLNLIYFSSLLLGLWLWNRTPRGFDVLGLFFVYSIALTLLIIVGAFFIQKNWRSASRRFKNLIIAFLFITGTILFLAFLLLSGIL